MMSEYLLSTSGLTKQFGKHKAVNDVNLHVKKGGDLRIYRQKWGWQDHIFEDDLRTLQTDLRRD